VNQTQGNHRAVRGAGAAAGTAVGGTAVRDAAVTGTATGRTAAAMSRQPYGSYPARAGGPYDGRPAASPYLPRPAHAAGTATAAVPALNFPYPAPGSTPYDSAPSGIPRAQPARHRAGPGAGTPSGPAPGTAAGTGARPRARARTRARARWSAPAERADALRTLVPQALVVAFLAGGTSAFVAHDKAVSLTVDGRARTLHTFAGDIGELLADEGVHLRDQDEVAPSPDRALADGDEIAVRHARPLTLTLDGRRRLVWTTARTVGGALRQLGVRTDGAYVSAPPGAHIPRGGRELDVRTERGVVFLADGREHMVRTEAATVREALAQAGLRLGRLDTTSASLDSFPRDGQTVTVMRVTGGEKVQEGHIPFRRLRRADPQLPAGTEVVAREGRPGVQRVRYRLRTVNGVRQKPERVSTEVLRPPRHEVVRVGTGPHPVPGAEGLDWAALARCESGGRPGAVDASGTRGGLYQFDVGTWHRFGGVGRPQHAPAAEQTYRAKKLYITRGAGAWPLCGRKLAR
jgi:resuscitation-promoting factor RpfB